MKKGDAMPEAKGNREDESVGAHPSPACETTNVFALPSLRIPRARRHLRLRVPVLPEAPPIEIEFHDLVTSGGPMVDVIELATRVAKYDSTVLITGESGTGKERIARLIHAESPRSQGPFIAINCGAISESLLESELFGHSRGAFTGATQRRPGLFEAANRMNAYNTYLNPGLPPGPINMPEPRYIDAVLNAQKNAYLYFCARETLDGYSNFAKTYEQHLVNARRYQRALNERGIMR